MSANDPKQTSGGGALAHLCAIGLTQPRRRKGLPSPAGCAERSHCRRHTRGPAQLSLNALFERSINPRPTELLALRHSPLKASVNTLPDHAALKLGKGTADLKH